MYQATYTHIERERGRDPFVVGPRGATAAMGPWGMGGRGEEGWNWAGAVT